MLPRFSECKSGSLNAPGSERFITWYWFLQNFNLKFLVLKYVYILWEGRHPRQGNTFSEWQKRRSSTQEYNSNSRHFCIADPGLPFEHIAYATKASALFFIELNILSIYNFHSRLSKLWPNVILSNVWTFRRTFKVGKFSVHGFPENGNSGA